MEAEPAPDQELVAPACFESEELPRRTANAASAFPRASGKRDSAQGQQSAGAALRRPAGTHTSARSEDRVPVPAPPALRSDRSPIIRTSGQARRDEARLRPTRSLQNNRPAGKRERRTLSPAGARHRRSEFASHDRDRRNRQIPRSKQ